MPIDRVPHGDGNSPKDNGPRVRPVAKAAGRNTPERAAKAAHIKSIRQAPENHRQGLAAARSDLDSLLKQHAGKRSLVGASMSQLLDYSRNKHGGHARPGTMEHAAQQLYRARSAINHHSGELSQAEAKLRSIREIRKSRKSGS